MFRFSIRDVLAITAIAGVTCGVGVGFFAADQLEEFVGLFWLFVFGVACYAMGAWRPATPNRPDSVPIPKINP